MKLSRMLLCTMLIALPRLAVAQADTQKSFAALKSLSGNWIGKITIIPAMPTGDLGDSMRVSLRTTSRGHALVHEMRGASAPDDPTKYDHPVTMIYLNDDGKLTLTHYCDAGNRPRMTARVSADGKTIDFDFVDISGKYDRTGHMQHATFTLVDADHHIEDWTWLMPNNQTARAHFELHREPVVTAGSGK
jgi:hypothetical protein